MKIIKKNKYTIMAVVLFTIIVFFLYEAKQLFFPNEGKAIYGDRLVGKVKVEDDVYKDLEDKIRSNDRVTDVTIREGGKLISIIITVQVDMSTDDAKKLIDNILEPFSDSQKGYYDYQIFITKAESSENNFPIIAYKHHNNSNFVWSKDRAKTETSEGE